MKKALMVVAAAGAAAFASQKYKQHSVGKDMWSKASDKPGSNSFDASSTSS
ncbi:DLW-39 family protein [Calidifontibacter terrae]